MAEESPPTLRVEELGTDQRLRWRRGERVLVESYLERYPSLQSDTERVLQLINNEVVLREELEGHTSPEEYLERFPQLHAQIEELFEVHRALESDSVATVRGEDAPQPAAGWPVVEGYEILAELGRGGMGVVYRARQASLGREVALKVPRPGVLLTGEFRERFVREARAAALLDHPNLVPVYEVGTAGALCFIASAYCPGITLTQWLARRSESVPARLAVQLVATLAGATQHAHERGVIHRDLKPSNVLLQWRPRPPAAGDNTTSGWPDAGFNFVPRITDFGLAKLTADVTGQADEEVGTPTQSGAVLGTPNYMAPEQAGGKNKEIGRAADIYALGAILYELLTGRPPFLGETVLDTLDQVRNREPLPPHRLRARLPRDLETICLKCLEKEPRKRYDSAAALADDLLRYLGGAPIQARPADILERGRKWARRKPAQALLVSVSTVAVITLLTVVLSYNAALANSNGKLTNSNTQLEETNTALEGSNAELQKINEILKQQRDAAREEARQSVEVLSDLFTNYQRDWAKGPTVFTMARIGSPSELRLNPHTRQMLDKYLEVCEQYLRNHENDPELDQRTGRVYSIIGEIHYLCERHADAEQTFQKALGLQRKLADQFPDQPQYKLDLIWTEHDRYYNFMDKGDIKQAEAAIKKVVEIKEQLSRGDPTNIQYRRELTEAYYELGDCCRKSGREQECLESHHHITRVWEQLVRDYPLITDFALQLAQSYNWLSGWMMTNGRTVEGFEWSIRGIRTLEALLKKEPRNYLAMQYLRDMYPLRARVFERMGKYQEAQAAWDRAIELDRGALGRVRDAYRLHRARSLAGTGEHAKATTEAQQLTAVVWADEFMLYTAAGVFALSSSAALRDGRLPEIERRTLAERYAVQAVECLRKSQAAGYFGYDSANRMENMRKDKDLEALRVRKDYQEFFLSLQPKSKSKANP